ncbi:hypothetical protein, variant 1 [Sphaeroforma arctica JP610]|uniref:MYND-type domain-containing protein n=1 Tax=Sphaeroforma arctica JP610 TaxID=667725 RepID=A0A0L0G139_9EUKA|nr:hypothetical protein, variant 1 [Sphaeroforma arctica JP610]KNC82800.1 hypothetical protein, variant 1 [Sphaeroforma arctica JP610]|eukprot:XP_014156702.1 hypothetical protein, variant 1 [Sphaeroforma arctica JP610]
MRSLASSKKAVYCNRVCQRHHWKAHREHCNARRGPSLANKGSHVRAGPVSNHSPAGFSPHKQQTTNKSPPVSRQVLVGLHERDSQRPMHTINTQYHPMRLSSKPKKISEQHMASSEHEISNRGTSVIIKSMQNVPIPLFRPKLLYPTLYISRFDSFVKKIHSSSLDLGKVSAPGENIKDTQTLTKTLSSEKLKPSPNDPEMYPFICRECDRVFDTCNARDACLHTECPEQMHQKQFAFVADAYQHCVREHKAESSSRTDEVVRPAMMSRNTSNSNRENEGIEVNVIYNAEDTLNKWASTMAGCNEDTRVRSDDEMQDASQRALDARAAADPGAGTRMYVESSGGVTVANAGLARLSDTPNASSNSGGKREIPMDVEGTQVDDTTSSAQSKPKSCSDGKTVHPPSREISDQSGPLRSDTYHDGLSQTYSSGDDLTRANAANDFESTSAIAIATPAVAVDLMEPVGGNNENAQNTAGDGQTIQKAPAQTAKTPRAQNIAYRVEKNISATDREITTVCYTAAHDILRASVGNHKSYEAYQEGGMTDTITEGMADTTTTEACGVGGKGIESEHSREATSAHSLAKAATTLPHGTDELPHGSIIVEQPTTTPCDPTPYKVSDTAAGWTDGDNGTMREAKDAEEVVINMCTSEPDTAIVEKVQVFSKDDELPSTNLSTLAAAAVISGFKENFGDVSDVRDSVSEPNHSKSSQVHATLESNTQDNPPTISLVSLVPSAPCTINPVIAEDSSTIDGTLKAHSPLVTDANVISDDDAVPIALSAVDRASCPDAPERDAQYATNTSGGVESTTSNVGVSPVSIGASAIENPSMDTNNIDLAPDLTAPISHINVSLVMETSLDVGCTTCGNDNPPIGVALSNSPHDDSVSQSIMDAPDDSCRAPHDSVFQSVVGAPDDSCRGGHDSVSHSVVGAPDNSCRGGP